MVANNAVPSGLRHDILLAFLSAYKKSPGICALTQHLVLCHNREKTWSIGNQANGQLPAVPLAKTAVWLEQHQKEDEALMLL